jgi:dienelactone hydrolase
MKVEDLDYRDGDLVLNGLIAYDPDAAGKRPGIVVYPEAWGMTAHAVDRTKMLVGLGYVALAADPFGGRRLATTSEQIAEYADGLFQSAPRFRARARAALNALAAHPRVDNHRLGAMGFCRGGTTVLELARDGAAIAGVVSFHGGLETLAPAKPGAIKTKILVCHGVDDPFVPPPQVKAFEAEMSAAGCDWQLITYGGTVHSFTNPNADGSRAGLLYNERADKRSWATMAAFWEEVFNTTATLP